MKRTIIGLDLDTEYSQVSYYNEKDTEPQTASIADNRDRCLIPTPADLLSLIDGSVELGLMALANFLKKCIAYIKPPVRPEETWIAITMREMTYGRAQALKNACEMLGIPREAVSLETHRESFCYYTLNQKRDLWMQKVALFEYEDNRIRAFAMSVDYATKPALVSAEPVGEVLLGKQGSQSAQQWNERRDQKFLGFLQKLFGGESFSAAYLVGDGFDKAWAQESLQLLCRKRHVFQGRNLYTKGACYGAMNRLGIGKRLTNYLLWSEDTVKTNLSMRMTVRGKTSNYLLINAGVSWFEAEHTCEFLTDGGHEILIYGKSIEGDGAAQSYSIPLKDLPDRPAKTTRLQLSAGFLSPQKCRITIRDLGFGEIYPASGLVWESILEV